MKQIKDLKQGDKIYDIESLKIRHYVYLCVHPTGGGNYHILIDENQEPFRIYGENLQRILNQDIKTRKEAQTALIQQLEECIKRIKDYE